MTDQASRPWPILDRPLLEADLREALGSGGVYLIGEAGSGKTVLAQRAIEALGAGVLHLRGTALAAEVPYGAFQAVLSELDDSELSDPLSVVRALRRILQSRFGGEPVVLLADNAQQIDDASAHVLALLAESGSAQLLIAGTNVLDGPRAFAELWRDKLVRTIEVPPFAFDEVARVATVYLGAPVVLSAVNLARESTGGNPLYLRYLLREWLESGALELHEGVWALAQPGDLSSPRFADLVAAQLGRWTGTRREALEFVALTEELPISLLLQLIDGDDLDALERAGVVLVDGDGAPTARIRNRFVAQIIRQGIPFGRRRALRERVLATGIEPGVGTAEQRLAFVVWSIECGVTPDPEFAAGAAETALELYDPALALRIAATVPPGAAFARASVARSVALRYLGLREHAAQALAGIDAVHRARLEPATVVALAVEEAAVYSGLEGRADDALAALAAARLAVRAAEATDPSPLAAALDVAEFEVLLSLGRHQELLGPLGDAYDRGPEAGAARWAAASAMYAETLAITGRQQEALRIVAELSPVAADPTLDRATAAVVRASVFGCLLKCGLWREVLGLGDSSPTAGRESLITGSVLDTLVGTVHLYSGRTGAALPALLAAHSQARVRDLFQSRGQIVAALAWTSALLGDSEAARRYLDAYGSGPYASFTSAISAELCAYSARLVLGDPLEAQILERAQGHLEAGHAMEGVLLLAALARRGSGGAIELLRSGPIEQPGPLAIAISDYAEGTATGDAGLLLRAAELLAHLGNDGFAVEAGLAAAAVPGADRAVVKRAQRVVQDCRRNLGSATPASGSERLSAREQEVAELAARRLSNQEIADRLHLSVRTVESYLQSAFGKLGINSRADLPDLLSA